MEREGERIKPQVLKNITLACVNMHTNVLQTICWRRLTVIWRSKITHGVFDLELNVGGSSSRAPGGHAVVLYVDETSRSPRKRVVDINRVFIARALNVVNVIRNRGVYIDCNYIEY